MDRPRLRGKALSPRHGGPARCWCRTCTSGRARSGSAASSCCGRPPAGWVAAPRRPWHLSATIDRARRTAVDGGRGAGGQEAPPSAASSSTRRMAGPPRRRRRAPRRRLVEQRPYSRRGARGPARPAARGGEFPYLAPGACAPATASRSAARAGARSPGTSRTAARCCWSRAAPGLCRCGRCCATGSPTAATSRPVSCSRSARPRSCSTATSWRNGRRRAWPPPSRSPASGRPAGAAPGAASTANCWSRRARPPSARPHVFVCGSTAFVESAAALLVQARPRPSPGADRALRRGRMSLLASPA